MKKFIEICKSLRNFHAIQFDYFGTPKSERRFLVVARLNYAVRKSGESTT